MRKSSNFKRFTILLLLIVILVVVKINIIKIINSSAFTKTKHLISDELKDNIKDSNYFKFIFVKLMTNTAKKKFSNEKILQIRDLILKDYILNPEQITFFEKPDLTDSIKFNNYPDKNSKIIGAKFYKINNYAIIEYPEHRPENKKKLLIYAQGHLGNPYNFEYFIDIKNHFKKKGFDVMSLSTSNLGYNIDTSNFPLPVDLKDPTGRKQAHKLYYEYYDEKFPNKKTLSLMLSGNYYLIKKILSESSYDEIHMVGISNGGWYTTFLSSIITEIESSYSFSGTLPLITALVENNADNDWEQNISEIFNKIDYWDLYFLSTLDKFGNENRKHFQIYNNKDVCCFRDPFASIMKKTADNLGKSNFRVFVFESSLHSINTDFLFSKF